MIRHGNSNRPSLRSKGRWTSLAKAFLLVACLESCTFAFGASRPLLNHSAPQFSLTDLNHQRLDLKAYRGKVVLLNFWATWCSPCQLEIPRFVDWQKEYGASGLQVVGISMDDDPSLVRKLDQRLRLNYPVAMGDAQLGENYGGIYGLPVTFLIDRDGKIRAEYQGVTDLGMVEATLRGMLKTR